MWGIGRVDEITPSRPATLVEAGDEVKRFLESQESERLFQERITAWRSELKIKTYPSRLDEAVYAPVNPEAPGAPGAKPEGASGEAHS